MEIILNKSNITKKEKVLALCDGMNSFYSVCINIFTNTCKVIIELFIRELSAYVCSENGYWLINKIFKFF